MKKKSHSIFAVLALALVIAAAIVVFALIRKYTPSKEHEDLTTYYHLTNSDEVAIVLNNEVTSSKARVIDGHIYIDYDFVHDNLNSRFYWDNNENILLYATTQNLISAQAEPVSYTHLVKSFFSSFSICYSYFCSKDSTCCGISFACDNTETAACSRIFCCVSVSYTHLAPPASLKGLQTQ